MTGPTHLDDEDDDLRLPAVESYRVTLDPDLSHAVMLCTFRLCHWQSPDVRTLPLDEQNQIVARHLLDEHSRELTSLAQLAREHGLIR
jgi:hypothetical protein